tara:strand:+ start:47085 stop:48410 length:1326 start_codon:yes stop_codon:yes gene_type:complete
MARLENFVPSLIPGRISEISPQNITYTFDSGEVKRLRLGAHMAPFVKLLNGTSSLSEAHVSLFQSEPMPIQVSEVLNALSLMGNMQMFVNNRELMETLSAFVDGHGYNDVQNLVRTEEFTAQHFTIERLRTLLKNTPLNAKNDVEILDYIIKKSRLMECPAGEIVIQEGVVGDSVYVLLTGEVGVYRRREFENPWEYISSIYAISLFGESAALPDKKRTATVMPIVDSWILEVPFQKLVNVNKRETFTDFNSVKTRVVVNQILQTAPMFSGLPSDALQEFVKRCELVQVSEGIDITFQKARSEITSTDVLLDASSFYFILDGQVEVIKDGKVIGLLNKGDYFGEVGALNKMGRTATCRALKECKLLTLSAESLNQVFAKNFRLALQVEKMAEDRLQKSLEGDHSDSNYLSPVHFDFEQTNVTSHDIGEVTSVGMTGRAENE